MTHEIPGCPLTQAAPEHEGQPGGERRDEGLRARDAKEPAHEEIAHPRERNKGHPDAEPILEIDSQDGNGGVEFPINRMLRQHWSPVDHANDLTAKEEDHRTDDDPKRVANAVAMIRHDEGPRHQERGRRVGKPEHA
jgi:hypothetical protein